MIDKSRSLFAGYYLPAIDCQIINAENGDNKDIVCSEKYVNTSLVNKMIILWIIWNTIIKKFAKKTWSRKHGHD